MNLRPRTYIPPLAPYRDHYADPRTNRGARRMRDLGLGDPEEAVARIADALDDLGSRHPDSVVLRIAPEGTTLEPRRDLATFYDENDLPKLARQIREGRPRPGYVHALVDGEGTALIELPLDTFQRPPAAVRSPVYVAPPITWMGVPARLRLEREAR